MKTSTNERAFKLGSIVAALIGMALFVGVIVYQDLDALGRILAGTGWGIIVISLFHLTQVVASGLAWRSAIYPVWEASPGVFAWARLLREAVSGLLPVSQIGGDIAGARILTFHGARTHIAGASVLADMTVEVVTQVFFTILGLLVLVETGGPAGGGPAGGGPIVTWALIGIGIAVPAVGGFLLGQRWGLLKLIERLLEWISGALGWAEPGGFNNLHDTILSLYRNHRAMATACMWHMASWFLGAAEVWLTLHFLQVDTSFATALIIESLGQAVRSAAFLVPGALGIQEGGYMALGVMFGLPPEVALSVSLVKRLRELVLGVPAMIAWQVVEGKRLLLPLGQVQEEET